MPLPNIAQGQIALDPLNGIFYYRDENNNLVSSSLSWLQDTLSSVSTVDSVTISSDLNVSGDLVIGGDTVSLNVAQVLIEDNILVLNYNFTGAPILNAGLEIERGNLANVQILWNEALDKWQFTNDGTTFLDLNSIIENSVTLGLHTVGNYTKNLVAGTGITIIDNSGEGATPRISIGQDISTGATPNFARVIAPLTGNVTGNVSGNLTGNVTGNVTGNLTGNVSGAVTGNVTGNLTGNVTGNVTGTVSDLSNHGISDFSDVTITSAADGDFLRYSGSQWINDPVNLATDTIGDYVKNLVQGNGITISNNSGEGATPNISINTSIVQTRVANISDTEIGYLDGVTSAIQTQIDTKAPTADPTFTGTVTLPANTISQIHLSDDSVGTNEIGGLAVTTGKLADGAVTSTKIANDTIVDADINSAAAIAQSKISGLTTDLGLKAPIANPTFTGTVGGITKSMVDLGNVDNTSDINKPVSIAQQTALNLKANSATPTFTGTVSGITKSMVGLGNVDNTSDISKPVSTAQQTALDLKSNSATPTFTGMVTAPYLKVSGIEIDTSGPVDTNVLKYNAALNKYIPGVASTVASLDDLTDVIISAATPNQVLKYDGSNWVNATAPSGAAGSTYFSTIGNGSTSTFTITHGLSTRDLVVSFTETAAPYGAFSTTWEATTINAVTVYFETPPSSNGVRVSIYAAVSGVALSTDLDSLSDVTLVGLANGDFLRYNGSVWINDPVNLSTDTVGDYVSSLVQGTGITITNNSGEGATPTISVTASTYQPLDADLTAIAALAGTSGILTKTSTDTWSLDTNTYLTTSSASSTYLTSSNAVTNYQPKDADLTAISALAGTSGLLKKTAADTWALDANTYITSLTLGQLTNVSAATPSNDEVLAWQSSTSQWVNKTFSATVTTLDTVGDVTVPSPSTGEFLKWNGSAWVNSNQVRDNQISYLMDVS